MWKTKKGLSEKDILKLFANSNYDIIPIIACAIVSNIWEEVRKEYNKPCRFWEWLIVNIIEWVEPEPNYNAWIGKWCVFSYVPITSHNTIVMLSILKEIQIDKYKFIPSVKDSHYRYCMLLTDYQNMIKGQE